MLTTRCRRFGPRLTVSLSEAHRGRLQYLAEQDQVSISWIIRRAIDEYLRRHPGARGERVLQTIPKRERCAV
jgi:hypothetical protein